MPEWLSIILTLAKWLSIYTGGVILMLLILTRLGLFTHDEDDKYGNVGIALCWPASLPVLAFVGAIYGLLKAAKKIEESMKPKEEPEQIQSKDPFVKGYTNQVVKYEVRFEKEEEYRKIKDTGESLKEAINFLNAKTLYVSFDVYMILAKSSEFYTINHNLAESRIAKATYRGKQVIIDASLKGYCFYFEREE